MDLSELERFSGKEMEQFTRVCNLLLSRTFVVRTIYVQDKGRISNPDYTFLSLHQSVVRDYLGLLDWDLRKDDYNGYFYVVNTDEANRCALNQKATAILLALRMIYDENQDQTGLEQDVLCTVHDLLDKVVADYAIFSTRPNMEEVKRALTIFEQHSILQRIQGRFSQTGCKFAILPTILTVVSSERLDAVVSMLRKEEEDGDEEADEDTVD